MYYVPHTPRQASGSPTPPGNIFADLDFDSLYFSDNFSVNNFSFDFPSPLNSPLSDPFIPNLGHYITDPLPGPPQASREPIFKTNPIQRVYSLHQYEPRLTVPENSSDVPTSHGISILEPQQSQQVLEPKSTIKAKREKITGEGHSNSLESTDSPDSNSYRDPQKRKLEDMMQTFSTVPDIPNNQACEKKRKNYDPKTRKKVALIRKFKPCKRCGIHRIACDLDGGCEGCLKYALGNLSLAKRFCHRRTLLELRFDGGFDWLYMKFNSTFIRKEIRGYRGPEMKMSLELDHLEVGEGHKLPLSIKVQEYLTDETEPLYNIEAMRNKSPEISIYDATTTYFFEAESPRYAITADSLPTVEVMVDWAKVELATAYGDPALRFAHSMAEFMALYCQQEAKLPLVTLLGSCIKLISLVHCWRCRKIVSTSSANNTQNLLSIAACSQLLLIIKEGIREAEIEILEGLEPHLYGSRGPGQKNAIPLWACLWSLILMYRDRMAAYNQYVPQTLAAYSEAFELMSATKHLYDIITAHYALLFNPSTPLHLDCKPDDNFELLGRSEGLRNAFDRARNEAFNFYNAHTHFIDQDKHLRQDIIAKEQNFVQRL